MRSSTSKEAVITTHPKTAMTNAAMVDTVVPLTDTPPFTPGCTGLKLMIE